MTGSRTTIVIPCYNEAARFPMARFRDFAAAHPDIQFLLVDDGSRDATAAMLEEARRGLEHQVFVRRQPKNGGKGEAVRAGIVQAIESAPVAVGFWDADFATPLESIPPLRAILDERPEVDMVFGARVKLLGRQIERRAIRHYLGRVFATVVSNLLELPIYDTQCGAKIFRVTPDTARLFDRPFSSRWVFDVEIIARYLVARQRDREAVKRAIYEFPLTEWRDVAGSKVRPRDFLRAFLDVLRIHRTYLG